MHEKKSEEAKQKGSVASSRQKKECVKRRVWKQNKKEDTYSKLDKRRNA